MNPNRTGLSQSKGTIGFALCCYLSAAPQGFKLLSVWAVSVEVRLQQTMEGEGRGGEGRGGEGSGGGRGGGGGVHPEGPGVIAPEVSVQKLQWFGVYRLLPRPGSQHLYLARLACGYSADPKSQTSRTSNSCSQPCRITGTNGALMPRTRLCVAASASRTRVWGTPNPCLL